MPPLRLCRVATVPITLTTLLYEQIRCAVNAGIELTLVSSPGEELNRLTQDFPVRLHTIPMARQPSPVRDLRSLIELTQFLRRERFDIVHSNTPKAGLLTAVAGRLAGVPIRLHTYTGQPWVVLSGPLRWMARQSDAWISRLNTHTYADSPSQREFLIAEGLVTAGRITVLGSGSTSGVNLRRFDPAARADDRTMIRAGLAIPSEALVILFVGRATRDKGINELVAAFQAVSPGNDQLHLVLVGPQEPERDPLPPETLSEIAVNPRIHSVGFTPHPEHYLAVADIFCLPSYREGFPNVIVEAGAMRLPSVATRITGVVDAVVEGQTGLLVPAREAHALAEALQSLITSPAERQRMGQLARERAMREFDADVVNRMLVDEYYRLACQRGLG